MSASFSSVDGSEEMNVPFYIESTQGDTAVAHSDN